MPSATAIKLNRHSGRDCRNPEAMEGKLVAEQVFDSGNLQPAVSPPCGLDSGNPCRNDGIYGPSGLVYNVKCWSVGKIANKGNPPLQKGGRGDFLGRLIPTCLILLALLLFVPAALAQTPISGAITSNAHWTVADGPYLVSSDVSIQNGAVLTIDPGATIYMGANASLTIQAGSIQAIGTAAKTIQVLSDKTRQGLNAAPGDWKQWVFGPGTVNTRLDYVEFAFGSGLAVQGSAPVFNYLNLHDHQGPAITVDLAASPSGIGNQASNNGLNGIDVPQGEILGTARWLLKGIPYVLRQGNVSVGQSPTLVSLIPNTLQQGREIDAVISGTRLTGSNSISTDASGISITNKGLPNDTTLPVHITANANSPLGSTAIEVLTDAGIVRMENALTILPYKPDLIVTGITPSSLRRGENKHFQVSGNNLQGVQVTLPNGSGLSLVNLASTQTTVDFDLNASVSATIGTQTLTLTSPNYTGSASASINVLRTMPELYMSPNPAAVPPDGKNYSISINLTEPDIIDHVIQLSIANTAVAQINPATITIPGGQISALATIKGIANGNTSLIMSTEGLASISAQVIVDPNASSANSALASLRVIKGDANAQSGDAPSFASARPLGIVKGGANAVPDTVPGYSSARPLGIVKGGANAIPDTVPGYTSARPLGIVKGGANAVPDTVPGYTSALPLGIVKGGANAVPDSVPGYTSARPLGIVKAGANGTQ